MTSNSNTQTLSVSDLMEGNKIIGVFHGARYSDETQRLIYDTDAMQDFALMIEAKNVNIESAKYHSSWDWLMPVVEKIEKIEDPHHGHFGVYISSNGCSIQATNLRTDKPMADPPHYFNDVVLDTKIKATWYAVIQFIQWYKNKGNNGE